MDADTQGLMDYQEWREEFARLERWKQRWETRQRFYRRILEMPSPDVPEIKWVCKAPLGTSTFYDHFAAGVTSPRRFAMHDDARECLVMETKAWSFDPYLQGVQDEFTALQPVSDNRVGCLIMALATWASDYPMLSQSLDCAAPASAVYALNAALGEVGEFVWEQSEAVARAAVEAVRDDLGQSPLSVLNAVLPAVRTSQAALGPVTSADALAEFTERLADVVLASLDSTNRTADSPDGVVALNAQALMLRANRVLEATA